MNSTPPKKLISALGLARTIQLCMVASCAGLSPTKALAIVVDRALQTHYHAHDQDHAKANGRHARKDPGRANERGKIAA
jgi:hypothetical protein